MIRVEKHSQMTNTIWNEFNKNAINGNFLFDRSYMDYHSYRFNDLSLLFYKKNKLIAILPGNVKDGKFYTHQGLTFGGFIVSKKSTVFDMMNMFNALNDFLLKENIGNVIYKAIPHIYHKHPCENELYSLFRLNATILSRDISSTIAMDNKIKFTESRKSGVRKSKKTNDILISLSESYSDFWLLLENNLIEKYGKTPVHSLAEIELLHSKFPENIKLYVVTLEDVVVAGTVIYEQEKIAHVQYISSNKKGKDIGALDYLFDHLINDMYSSKQFFDFGISTEEYGNKLNNDLIFQKEGFGARGVVYDRYEYSTHNNIKVED